MTQQDLTSTIEQLALRAKRLEEWTKFEPLLCDLRDSLLQYNGKLQKRLSKNLKKFQNADSQIEMRIEWEEIGRLRMASLTSYKAWIELHAQPLEPTRVNVTSWIQEILAAAEKIQQAFLNDEVPTIPTEIRSLQATLITRLKDYEANVNSEISALLQYIAELKK